MIDINPLFVIAIFFYFASGYGDIALIAYLSALIHEISHIVVASFFGIKLDKFKVHCCGFCAVFKSFKRSFFKTEFFVSFSGPFANFIIICICCFFFKSSMYFNEIVTINLYMMILNLLPIYPLDGGRIFKSFLKYEFGFKNTKKVIEYVSVIIIGIFIVFTGFQIINNHGNYSLLILFIYLLSQSTVGNTEIEIFNQNNICEFKTYKCNENLTLGEVVLQTGITENIVFLLTNDENNFSGIITGEKIKDAALGDKYNYSLKKLL